MLLWFGECVDVGGDFRVALFNRYDFCGSIGVNNDGGVIWLIDVNILIVLSLWVNDINGMWREV